jgi:hypothetical protein
MQSARILLASTAIAFLQLLMLPALSPVGAQPLSCSIADSAGEPIAYVNVYAPQKDAGAISDDKGRFTLDVGDSDTLMFSCIGYEEKKITAGALRNPTAGCRVVLEEKHYEFPVVEVKATRYRKRKAGLETRSDAVQIWFIGDNEQLGKEIGTVMSNSEPCFIEQVGFNLISVNFDSLLYEINIYELADNKPGRSLNRERIFGWVSRSDARKSIEIDLSAQHIYVEGDFFVSVEAVHIASEYKKYALTFPGALFSKKSLLKGVDGRWKPETTVSIFAKMKCVR